MKEVTIKIDRVNGNDVIQWCFENLSRPAILITWMIYQGKRSMSCPTVWRKWTTRLHCSPYGTTVSIDGRIISYMTMGFKSDEDATLFAVKWGSVPFEKNEDVASLTS